LRPVPAVVALPGCPNWMLGIFPHRSQFIALVDPLPLLSATVTESNRCISMRSVGEYVQAAKAGQTSVDQSTGPTALLIGSGERCVAWSVSAVGDIIRLTSDSIREFAGMDDAYPQLDPRYSTGKCVLDESGEPCVVVQAHSLLEDQLARIAESATLNA